MVLFPWILLASIVVAHVVVFRLVEPRRWAVVGLERRRRDSARSQRRVARRTRDRAPVVLLLAVGWLRAEPGPPGSSVGAAFSLVLFLGPAALWEEMLVRGYAFAVLREWWGPVATLGVTSIVFGLVHLRNAGASVASTLVVMLAGVFLGGVLLVTRSL